mgnify:CR=1 FL=1
MTQDSQLDIPVIDVSALVSGKKIATKSRRRIGQACRDWGFFYIVGHGVDEHLQRRLEEVSRQFFAQDLETKLEIKMSHGGRAWRGYFPVGGELTSGKPDLKEGIYFGAELEDDHPLVMAGTPLHGPNLFPADIPPFRETVLAYMAALTTARPLTDGRHRSQPRLGRILLFRPVYIRTFDTVSDLQLSSASA